VLSAVLATILAMNVGFTCVMLIAITLYLVAAATLRRPLAGEGPWPAVLEPTA
jgi:hypothetical protein